MAFVMDKSTYGIKGFPVIGKILMNRNIVLMHACTKFVYMLATVYDFRSSKSEQFVSPNLLAT